MYRGPDTSVATHPQTRLPLRVSSAQHLVMWQIPPPWSRKSEVPVQNNAAQCIYKKRLQMEEMTLQATA